VLATVTALLYFDRQCVADFLLKRIDNLVWNDL